jgi:hypothetical protein
VSDLRMSSDCKDYSQVSERVLSIRSAWVVEQRDVPFTQINLPETENSYDSTPALHRGLHEAHSEPCARLVSAHISPPLSRNHHPVAFALEPGCLSPSCRPLYIDTEPRLTLDGRERHGLSREYICRRIDIWLVDGWRRDCTSFGPFRATAEQCAQYGRSAFSSNRDSYICGYSFDTRRLRVKATAEHRRKSEGAKFRAQATRVLLPV